MRDKAWKKWTDDEDELLRSLWSTSPTKESLLTSFTGRGYNSLMNRAGKLGIVSGSRRKRKNGSLEILKQHTPESYYLWGFAMADGHFSDSGSLTLNQRACDFEYIAKLYSLMGGKPGDIKIRSTISGYTGKELIMCQARVGHKQVLDDLRQIVGLSKNKTYTPPNIEYFFNRDCLIYFLIGLIDGDGSIWLSNKGRSSPTFQIMMHSSWLPVLRLLSNKVHEYYDISTIIKMSKSGYALMTCADQDSMRLLNDYAKPFQYKLNRKWDRIPTDY